MRTTIDVPEPVFRKMKATAALRGVSLKDFVLSAVEHEMAKKRAPRDYMVQVPLIRSRRPGKLNLTNAEIEDLLT
jgi:Antitoxin ParD